MKKKLIITAAVFCAAITVVWFVCRLTGMLLIFSIPTPSNLPNIKPGDKVYSSTLKDPAPYSFIIYTSHLSDSLGMVDVADGKAKSHYLHRLCGLPGNIIEMKNGILYVNNKNFDKKINLNNQYKISSTEFNLIEKADIEDMYKFGATQMSNYDSTLVILDSVLLKKYGSKIKLVQYLLPNSQEDAFKWNNKNETWTVDNFGPLKIPHDCYFVLGDNRHNALDSRYIGFVKKENIKGVALNK